MKARVFSNILTFIDDLRISSNDEFENNSNHNYLNELKLKRENEDLNRSP